MKYEFDVEDARLVTSKLAGILSIELPQARELVKSNPTEVEPIDRVMRKVASEGARDWMNHSMAALPLEAWASHDGAFSVEPTKQASLRYLIVDSPDPDSAFNHRHVRSREELCGLLFQELGAEDREAFESIATWGKLQLPEKTKHSHLTDVLLADSIYLTECLYYDSYARFESEVRRELALPTHTPTPPVLIRRLADAAQVEVHTCLENMAATSAPGDNLIVRVLCNVAANRALLESAKIGSLAQRAERINVSLLEALNRNGVDEVQEVNGDADIRVVLLKWFGPDGLLAAEPGFDRPLCGENLAVTIERAKEVQTAYVATRVRGAEPLAWQAFRSPSDRLIFALALVGSFYAREELDTELSGGKNKSYKAFPGPTSTFRHGNLPPHAMELFKCQFGQLAMANEGWKLSATRVQEYARALAYKRARLQELVFAVFKRWTAAKLLTLHTTLMKERERYQVAS